MAIKIKIDNDLHGKLIQCAEAGGYSSTDEFIMHVLEKDAENVLGGDEDVDKEKVKERLRGLGYLS